VDRWELNVGDSLIRNIEDAITNASAIVFVLSKASVESEWCRKELTAGLVRELEEKHVLVLPVLLEDCRVPLFLRDKKYADFQTDFDSGLRDIISALAKVTNDAQGRLEIVNGHVDWSTDWQVDNGLVTLQLIAVERANGLPFTTLSLVSIDLNERASQRHLELAKAGLEPFARQLVLETLAGHPACDEFFVYIKDAKPADQEFGLRDEKPGFEFVIVAECHRLGTDTGKDLVLDLGKQIQGMAKHGLRALRPAQTDQEVRKLREIMLKYRPDLQI
jgi:hypothetical protein